MPKIPITVMTEGDIHLVNVALINLIRAVEAGCITINENSPEECRLLPKTLDELKTEAIRLFEKLSELVMAKWQDNPN